MPELGAVAVSCAFLGSFGAVLLLPVCERLGVGLLRFSAAAQEARELRQQGEAVETEAIAGRVRATFLLPVEVAGRLAEDVVMS